MKTCRRVLYRGSRCLGNKDAEAEVIREQDCRNIIEEFGGNTLETVRKLMSEYSELEYYREVQEENLCDIIGTSPAFKAAYRECLKAARTDCSVLLTGETGTGKEVFARLLHSHSDRGRRLFVAINCAAIPPELMEAELFGYVEGAFTGAARGRKRGKLELASHGTVFLNEIGDMPLSMQEKLLRALQEREIVPVGADRPVPVDIRVIASTRQNLERMVAEGTFREELYDRLNVIGIHLPPLRERGTDILDMANHFLGELNQKYRTRKYFSRAVSRAILQYKWPGNVRELQNAVQSAFTLSDEKALQPEDFPARIFSAKAQAGEDAPGSHVMHEKEEGNETPADEHLDDIGVFQGHTLHEMVEEYEKDLLFELLERCDYNYTQAAREAGIHRSLLYKKMAKYRMR